MSRQSVLHRLWRTDELRSIFEHQMASLVEFDLGNVERGAAARLAKLAESEHLLVKNFRSLFEHPCPPVELLILTKDFAKANIDHPDSAIPDEIARVLYYESILLAWTRCGKRITALDDQTITDRVKWAISQAWLDEGTRRTLADGLTALESHGGA